MSNWSVTPSGQTTNAGVATGNYTIATSIINISNPQAFGTSDGGGGGTFSPTGPTIPPGGNTATFTYANTTPGTYALTITPPSGAGYNPATINVTAVVNAAIPTVPQMDYVGAPPWTAPPMQARAFAGGLGFFTPGAAPAPPGIMVVFGQTAPPAPAGGQATRGYNGVVQADPPPAIVNNLAFLRISFCRDNRGARWTEEYEVGQKADIDSCGGCWLGNGFGCLYSQQGNLFWVRSDNPHDWSGATPQPVTVTTGHVYGMAQNRFGVLCAVVNSSVILSRDRGATWSAPIIAPISDPSAKPVTIVTASDDQAFVIVQPNGDGTNPTHWVSYDGGATWS